MRTAELNYHAWADASTYVLHATVNRIYDSRERRKCMQILHRCCYFRITVDMDTRMEGDKQGGSRPLSSNRKAALGNLRSTHTCALSSFTAPVHVQSYHGHNEIKL